MGINGKNSQVFAKKFLRHKGYLYRASNHSRSMAKIRYLIVILKLNSR